MPIIRVSSDEGKPHSSKAGRREASQRAYKRQFGGSKKRAPTDIVKKLRNALAGGIKGKPHSSPEGQAASAGRTIKRLGQRREDSLREIKPFKRKQAEIQTKLKSPEEYKAGGAVTRFRSSGPEGKPHSTKEGRSAEAQRAYMRQHGPQEPRRKRIWPKRAAKATGSSVGKTKGREGGPKYPIQPMPPDYWRNRLKDLGRRKFPRPKENLIEKLGGSEKAKPHSTREGRVASGERRIRRILKAGDKPRPRPRPRPRLKPWIESPNPPKPKKRFMTPLRAKKGVGGIAKIIGRKAVEWIKKNRKTIKKEVYSPEGKKKTQDLTKKLQEGLKKPGHAKGGRIGLQHGNRPRPQGPHTWVKSGGAVLKGKKVGIQIK